MAADRTYVAMQKFSFKTCFALSVSLRIILILGTCEESVIGTLTLSPMMVAPVCHVGDPLGITCRASVQFIRWSILQVNEQGSLEMVTTDADINSRDTNQISQRVVNSATFTFMRSSAQRALPLISTSSIDSINIGLNGTVVRCADVGDPMTSASTTIQIIDINQYTPTMNVISEEYYAGNVSVTVKWTQQVGAMYNATVIPPVPIMSTGSTSRQLTISYNTEYNLSVVAVVPCRDNATAFIRLHYANCGHPELLSTSSNDSVPRIIGYDNLPIEGSSITFSCPPGRVLTGPNSSTCMENGEWEPDPSGLMCKVTCEHPLLNKSTGSSLYILDYSEPAVVGATISFNCSEAGHVLTGPNIATCMNDGQWVPDPNHLWMNCKVSCGAPATHENVNYSSYNNSTLEGSTITFRCTNMLLSTDPFTSMCYRNTSWFPDPVSKCTAALRSGSTSTEALGQDGKIAIASSISIFIVASTLFFIVGFLCGHFCRKERKTTETVPCEKTHSAPYYDDVVLKQHEEELELKENVAYGPVPVQ